MMDNAGLLLAFAGGAALLFYLSRMRRAAASSADWNRLALEQAAAKHGHGNGGPWLIQ
jgi:hypothetical protein